MRMVVLGHSGMLGHMAVAWFSHRGYCVETIAPRFDVSAPDPFIRAIVSARPDVVINAIGLAKPRSTDWAEALIVNAALPWLLRRLLPRCITLVHPSTDCVFDGSEGDYAIGVPGSASNPYGLSKALGEGVSGHENTVVVRTSVIGPELPGRLNGLLGWFLSQPEGRSVPGYVDQFWNGLTTLEWCKFVDELITAVPEMRPKLVQPGTLERWSKAEMLELFGRTWKHPVKVEPVVSGTAIDRTLRPTHVRKNLAEQVQELRDWYIASR